MSATGDAGGFTLIEMLVVLAVAALIAGIGFPRLQAILSAQEWRTSVAAVTALLRDGRARALRSGVVAVVAVAPDGRHVRLGDARDITLPDSITAATDRPVVFFADGSASGGVITIAGSGRTAQLRVASATGLVAARTS